MLRYIAKGFALLPDPFLPAILGAAIFGLFLPCSGVGATVFQWLTTIAITMMFFLQGVRLSRQAVVAGLAHWRLHLVILACTFVVYPLLGLALRALAWPLLTPQLWTGIIFLCLLPSTVQSSIAYVSIARGSVAAAVCSATASNLLGIVLTPFLASLVLHTQNAAGGSPLGEVGKVALRILLPFVVGQLLRPWLLDWATRHKRLLTFSDRGSIILAVYTAFSAATLQGVWRTTSAGAMAWMVAFDLALLAAGMGIALALARLGRFPPEDEVAILFCGSKKSLATGAPMATVLFPAATVGAVMVPIVLFHQMQLMAAAVIARRYAQRPMSSTEPV